MSCPIVNKTKEEVSNIVKHKGMLLNRTDVQTQADLVEAIKYINDNLVKPVEEGAKYTFMGIEVQRRVSDLPKKVFERRMGKRAKGAHESPDNVIKREGGTRVHSILEGLVNFYANKVGNITEIRYNAKRGDFAVNDEQLDTLEKTAKTLITQINTVQESIDKNGKAEIMVEVAVLDPVKDVGGTIDVLAVFSDASTAVFDYKTMVSKPNRLVKREGKTAKLVDSLTDPYKMESFQLSVGEYKRILTDRYFTPTVKQSRIVPIHVRYKTKDTKDIKEGAALTRQLDILQAGADMSQFLRQIPVAGEPSQFKGIDKLLNKQAILLKQLQDKLTGQKLPEEERNRIRDRVRLLENSIQETIVSGDIKDIIATATRIVDSFQNRADEPQLKEDNTPNPLYLSDAELQDLVNELSIYKDIIEDTALYFKDLKDRRPELFEELRRRVNGLSAKVQLAEVSARTLREQRALDYVEMEYKDDAGNLLATDELKIGERNFSLMSEIDHPIFRAAWERIQKVQYQVRRDVKNLDERVAEVEAKLFSWAKSQGMSRQAAYDMMINFETGNLHSQIGPELLAIRNKAYEDQNVEALKEIFRIKDTAQYEKDLEKGFERAKEYLKGQHNNLKDSVDTDGTVIIPAADHQKAYKRSLLRWAANHDLLESNQAWLQEYNLKHLEFKPEVINKYKSDEYRAIEKHKPLLEYYNMFVNLNDEFRDLLGLYYRDMPTNFIPNIRRDFIEHIDQKGTNFGTAIREMWHGLHTRRDEDVHLGDMDVNGELRRSIPLLFTNPLKNKRGEIDKNIKSYDLGKSLRLFGQMAYNYNYMNQIEPIILSLKDLLGNPTPEQGGTQVTDTLGRKVRGPLKDWAVKSGIDTDTYKVFQDLTDVYLYGIRFKEKSFIGGMNTTQVLLRLKEYHAKRALAFAVIPATGAAIAGKTGIFIEGRKGMSYTSQHQAQAKKDMILRTTDYRGLAMFFEPYAEDPTDRLAKQRAVNFNSRLLNARTMFMPLRKVDENITNEVLNSMAYNYGIDQDGNLIRMNKPGVDLTGVKSIKELYVRDEKTGKIDVPGMSEDAYIAFRAAVKNTVKGIIGSLSQEEVARYDANLVMNLMMAFKSWMPGIVNERVGKLKYDPYSQMFKMGRFRAVLGELAPYRSEIKEKGGPTESTYNDGLQIMSFVKEIAGPAMGKLILDLTTFGLAPTLGLKRVNTARARRRFTEWQLSDKKFLNATFEDYLEVKEKQIKAALVELRIILGMMSLILYMGGEGEDGQPRYMDTWFYRTVYKAITKAQSELSFMWNPDEFIQLVKNPIPLASLLGATKQTVVNTVDEALDWATGRPDTQDKSPVGYYSMQWMYGGSQVARLIEIYKQYEKSPY